MATTILGTGGGADTLNGNAGNDTLSGGAGSDTLNGGIGSDLFRFDAVLNATTNMDTIIDYSIADDTIQLENAIFATLTATGPLNANYFVGGVGVTAAVDFDDYLIYNSATERSTMIRTVAVPLHRPSSPC